jgi:hypothetical protein
MERSASLPVPLAAIGSVLATAATLLLYIQAHHAGHPGGYAPVMLGAIAVGLLVAGCSYFGKLQAARSGFAAILLGVLASVAFFGILFVTLIWGFGS